MNFLHLDHAFAVGNTGIAFEAFTFSGGEPHVKIKSEIAADTPVTITQRINSFNDLGLLFMATDALRRMGVAEIHAVIPYFPAARQDRLMIPGEPLSVKVYADLINAQGYKSVTIFDPHSDVTPALLNNVHTVTNMQYVKECVQDLNDYLLIAPDGGALKKVYKVSDYLDHTPVVVCNKKRDVTTGKITQVTILEDDLEGKTCVIVDDICDGGATFINVAQKLKEHKAGDIYLVVSHGIFSKGVDVLVPYFKKIFTTDSVKTIEHENLVQIPLLPFLLK